VWAHRLNAWGYVTVILDSFNPRETNSVCSAPDLVPPVVRVFDVYGTAPYLRKQSFVNPKEIGLIVFSHGGWTALYASQGKLVTKAQEDTLPVIIAYYPWCPRFGLKETNSPLLILIGKEDDWTPLERCKKFLGAQDEEFKKYVRLTAYNHSYHGFDDPSRDPGSKFFGHILAFDRGAAVKSIYDSKAFFAHHLNP